MLDMLGGLKTGLKLVQAGPEAQLIDMSVKLLLPMESTVKNPRVLLMPSATSELTLASDILTVGFGRTVMFMDVLFPAGVPSGLVQFMVTLSE